MTSWLSTTRTSSAVEQGSRLAGRRTTRRTDSCHPWFALLSARPVRLRRLRSRWVVLTRLARRLSKWRPLCRSRPLSQARPSSRPARFAARAAPPWLRALAASSRCGPERRRSLALRQRGRPAFRQGLDTWGYQQLWPRAPAGALVRASGARRGRSWWPCRRGAAFRAPRALRRHAVGAEHGAARTFTRVRRAERASPPAGQLSSGGVEQGFVPVMDIAGRLRLANRARQSALRQSSLATASWLRTTRRRTATS